MPFQGETKSKALYEMELLYGRWRGWRKVKKMRKKGGWWAAGSREILEGACERLMAAQVTAQDLD